LPASKPWFGLLVVAIGTLVVPFDSTVNFAFPAITRAFSLPISDIQFVVIAYTLTYAALMLVFGRVGDLLGYRRIFLVGSAWSTASFLLCAAAPSYAVLLAARVAQGIGAALVLSCGPALATALYPESARTRMLGLYTMVIGVGGALGPPIAGLLVPIWDWPSVFWFRAPLAFAAFVLGWRLPSHPPSAAHRDFDAPGGLLLILAIAALLLALNQLQHLTTGVSAFIAAALAAALFGVGFVWRERKTPRPMIDLRYFCDGDFALMNAAHVALNLAGFAVLLLVPFYLARFGALSAHAIGLLLACSPIGTVIVAPLAGRLVARIEARRLALLGALCMAIGQLLIARAGAEPVLLLLAGPMLLQGIGIGLFQVAFFDVVTTSLPPADRGVAGSLVMMTRTIGTVMGATVLMLLFQTLRGAGDGAGFLAGFSGTFRFSAMLPAAVVVLALLHGWARGRQRQV
jgi:MFS family permease